MLADELGHLEHVDRVLVENDLQGLVGIDVALVLGILQLVLLDVRPELLDHLGAGKGLVADDLGELSAGGEGLHECIVLGHYGCLLAV